MGPSIPLARGSKLLYVIIGIALAAVVLAGLGLLLTNNADDENADQFDPALMVWLTGSLGPDKEAYFSVEVQQDSTYDRSDITDINVTDELESSNINMVDDDQDGYNDGDLNQDHVLQFGEVWRYNITYVIPSDAVDPLTNLIEATGLDGEGDPIQAVGSIDLLFQFQVGDSFKFQYSGSVNGSMWINVTAVDQENKSYTCSVVFNHDDITEEPGPWYFGAEDLISPFGPSPTSTWLEEDLLSLENFATSLGVRSVRHYQNVSAESTWDMYTDPDMKVMYRYVRTMEDNPLLVELVQTNVDWL